MKLSPTKTPDELVEDGIASIAAGLFRSKTATGSSREAVNMGAAALSTLSSMLMDFRRLLAKETDAR